jgi:signal transduction histidine kinase
MRYRVEAEGGSMQIRSAPGQGTVIEATLPALDVEAAASAADPFEAAAA